MKLSVKESKEILSRDHIAFYPITSSEKVLIYDIQHGIDDYIIWTFSNDDIAYKSKIQYNKNGDLYFRGGLHGTFSFKLSEFLRV